MVANSPQTQETPYFVHDCDRCTFLGNHNGFDLYHCLQGGVHQMPTVIARYGDDGPSYKSGLEAADYDSELSVARTRARSKGLNCG